MYILSLISSLIRSVSRTWIPSVECLYRGITNVFFSVFLHTDEIMVHVVLNPSTIRTSGECSQLRLIQNADLRAVDV